MQHGTVCVTLDDGASNCPTHLLPKKQAVDHQLRIHLSDHDRFKLMVMQDMGLNLNHLIAATKVVDFYNRVKKDEGFKTVGETIKFGTKTGYVVSEHLAEISRNFVDKMDRLNAMQFRLMGAHGKELVVARQEFKTAYFDAMDELNKVSKLSFISPDTQLYFDNQMRVRAFGRAGVYVNDLDDVERLRRIAENTKSINLAMSKFAFLASAGEIIYDAATGGDWQKDVKDTITEYLVGRSVGFVFGLLIPGGWALFIIEVAAQVLTEKDIQYVIDHPELMKKMLRPAYDEAHQYL